MKFLLLLALTGCMTNKKMLNNAKNHMNNINCLKKIEKKFFENQGPNIEVYKERNLIVFRCKKPDIKRKNFWDTWWFRITSPILKIPPELALEIEQHTICIDSQIRLEAYPPEESK